MEKYLMDHPEFVNTILSSVADIVATYEDTDDNVTVVMELIKKVIDDEIERFAIPGNFTSVKDYNEA